LTEIAGTARSYSNAVLPSRSSPEAEERWIPFRGAVEIGLEANDHVQAYDARSSASVWSQPALENRSVSAPAVLGNNVVVGDVEGYLHFMSQVDGHFVARYRADSEGVVGDMLAINDVLYVLGNDGRLLALRLN
jgi:outer membrane protein assembly factor BamB